MVALHEVQTVPVSAVHGGVVVTELTGEVSGVQVLPVGLDVPQHAVHLVDAVGRVISTIFRDALALVDVVVEQEDRVPGGVVLAPAAGHDRGLGGLGNLLLYIIRHSERHVLFHGDDGVRESLRGHSDPPILGS